MSSLATSFNVLPTNEREKDLTRVSEGEKGMCVRSTRDTHTGSPPSLTLLFTFSPFVCRSRNERTNDRLNE